MGKQIIEWVGHGSWKMTTPAGTTIYLDPWLEGNPSSSITIADAAKDADIVCVTHGHDDHIGDSIELCKQSGAVFVTLPEVAAYAALHGIPQDDRGGSVHLGGKIVQKDCTIRAVFALHAADILGYEYKESGKVMPGCGCCGMIIEPEGGKPVYFAGDTGVFGDMELISKLYNPYVSILPIGDKYVMGVREAAYSASLLKSPIIVPGHYNTFPAIMADTDELEKQMKVLAPHSELKVLNPGESFEI